MVSSKKSRKTKDSSFGKLSFWLSLGCIVPLLGFFFGAVALVFGIIGVSRAYSYPDKYGGLIYGVAGMTIVLLFAILWVWALMFYPERILGN